MALVLCHAHSPAMATEQTISLGLPEIGQKIRVIRGRRVLLDSDLAALYGVKTKVFNQAVRRNLSRFPSDFLLTLEIQDLARLRSQTVTSNAQATGRGGRRHLPLAFTEHGAVMAATVLNSPRAIEMSVYVVRAFVELRTVLTANAALAHKLDALEKSVVVLDADSKRQFKELRTLVFSLAMPPTKEQ
jgi:hypothetical protein